MKRIETGCVVAGGGPAGMMSGYLFARAGVPTIVLEKHGDFLRDFRGDTVHPSTMQIMKDLDLLEDFLKLPHSKVVKLRAEFGEESVQIVDLSRLNTPCPYVAFMPQWDFLDFLATKGKKLPAFEVCMRTKVTDLLREGSRIVGVMAETDEGPLEIRAALTIGADGRRSVVREAAKLPVRDRGSSIDVMWFRVSKRGESAEVFGHVRNGVFMVTIDRGDYWQCAYVIRKDAADAVKARGLEAFRKSVVSAAPELELSISEIKSWDDVKLLTVGVTMLEHWSAPGVLCIGDAAHTMSPVGGVGINLAIQDAVAAANILGRKLAAGTLEDYDLEAVQKRRELPASLVQRGQVFIHRRVLEKALDDGFTRPPLPARIINRSPMLQTALARVIGLGFRPERVLPK